MRGCAERLCVATFRAIFTLARRRAPRPEHQLPFMRLHDVRHLHATLLLLEGVPIHVVANRAPDTPTLR
jgi:hypothetical protein